MLLSILYLIGITAESITGALAAGREKMDLFGVTIISSVTAIGGGTVRDVLLGHYPVGWVKHPEYFLLVASASLLTVLVAPFLGYFRLIFLVLDALGLIVFSIIGARVAMEMGYGLVIASVAGVITGAFGGVLRDLLCNRIPLVFQKELYASVAFVSSCLFYGLMKHGVPFDWAVIATLLSGFSLRLCAMRFKWRLPIFEYNETAYIGRGRLWDRLAKKRKP